MAATARPPPASAQPAADTEVENLLEGIQEQQERIGEAVEADERLRASRAEVDRILQEANQQSIAGNAAAARASLQRARDAAVAGDAGTLNRIVLATATVELRAGNLEEARRLLDEASRGEALSESQRQRLTTLQQRLAQRSADIARRAAEEKAKAAERAAKERLDRELAAIEALPSDEAVAAARRLYETNPQNEDIALTYARLLARDWQWEESERIYLAVIGTAAGGGLIAKERAVLGLVDLYTRTNRLAQANTLLSQLEAAHGGTIPPDSRIAVLRARIDEELMPNQLSGAVTANTGYDSNVPASIDIDDDRGGARDGKGSAFIGGRGRVTYARVISANGDKLLARGDLSDMHYFEQDLDRGNFDVAAGYLHPLPGTTTEFETLVGYYGRFRDSDVYRRVAYVSFNMNKDILRQLDLATSLVLEAIDDDNPDRDGVAGDAEVAFGYDLTDNDTIEFAGGFRYEDARANFESRWEVAASVAYRHEFNLGSMQGFYVLGSYAPSFTQYAAAAEAGEPAREDVTHRLNVALGREFNENWLAELRGTYTARVSNIEDKDAEYARVMLSVTRQFSTGWR